MSIQEQLRNSFSVSVRVSYDERESRPDEKYYFFCYRISIRNNGNSPAQLMSRHWVIIDANGKSEEVRGAGVVGVQPKIQPGQSFEYESFCPLCTTSGSMKGHYQLTNQSGDTFDIEIPEFFLVAPSALH